MRLPLILLTWASLGLVTWLACGVHDRLVDAKPPCPKVAAVVLSTLLALIGESLVIVAAVRAARG